LAVMMYVQDYDETYPRCVQYADADYGDTYVYWNDLIEPYTKNDQVFICPSGVTDAIRSGNYGMNPNVMVSYQTNPTIKMAAINAPANTYMMMDYGTYRTLITYVDNPTASASYLPGIGDVKHLS